MFLYIFCSLGMYLQTLLLKFLKIHLSLGCRVENACIETYDAHCSFLKNYKVSVRITALKIRSTVLWRDYMPHQVLSSRSDLDAAPIKWNLFSMAACWPLQDPMGRLFMMTGEPLQPALYPHGEKMTWFFPLFFKFWRWRETPEKSTL